MVRTTPDGAVWRKSSYSGAGGDCVEVADDLFGGIWVRDSKGPDGNVLAFSSGDWHFFLRHVKDGAPC
ncbi:DUF397 domain-containing protein [Streptomyces sp. NPDC003077]|uniref:DUF397 domain-containing protein n=1 Tax=Streptomyces sp. NPDC003077 TaxID=3154443 RepID=UPI0033A309B1